MPNIVWDQSYSPAEAERGKFVVVDPTTITNYPSSGRGRYAVIVTSIDSSSANGFTIPAFDTILYGYTSSNLISSETYNLGSTTVAQIYKYYSGTNLISAVRTI